MIVSSDFDPVEHYRTIYQIEDLDERDIDNRLAQELFSEEYELTQEYSEFSVNKFYEGFQGASPKQLNEKENELLGSSQELKKLFAKRKTLDGSAKLVGEGFIENDESPKNANNNSSKSKLKRLGSHCAPKSQLGRGNSVCDNDNLLNGVQPLVKSTKNESKTVYNNDLFKDSMQEINEMINIPKGSSKIRLDSIILESSPKSEYQREENMPSTPHSLMNAFVSNQPISNFEKEEGKDRRDSFSSIIQYDQMPSAIQLPTLSHAQVPLEQPTHTQDEVQDRVAPSQPQAHPPHPRPLGKLEAGSSIFALSPLPLSLVPPLALPTNPLARFHALATTLQSLLVQSGDKKASEVNAARRQVSTGLLGANQRLNCRDIVDKVINTVRERSSSRSSVVSRRQQKRPESVIRSELPQKVSDRTIPSETKVNTHSRPSSMNFLSNYQRLSSQDKLNFERASRIAQSAQKVLESTVRTKDVGKYIKLNNNQGSDLDIISKKKHISKQARPFRETSLKLSASQSVKSLVRDSSYLHRLSSTPKIDFSSPKQKSARSISRTSNTKSISLLRKAAGLDSTTTPASKFAPKLAQNPQKQAESLKSSTNIPITQNQSKPKKIVEYNVVKTPDKNNNEKFIESPNRSQRQFYLRRNDMISESSVVDYSRSSQFQSTPKNPKNVRSYVRIKGQI